MTNTPTCNRFEDRLLDAMLERYDDLAHVQGDELPIRSAATATARRTHRRLTKVTAFACAVTATSTAAILAVILGSTPTPAFAGWSPAPTPPSSGQLQSATSGCQIQLGDAPYPSDKVGTLTGTVLLSDVRGPYTFTLLGNGASSNVLCLSSSATVWTQQVPTSSALVPSDGVNVDDYSLKSLGGPTFTLVEGEVGTAVTGVAINLGDGTTVTATTGDGMFLAWWPGSQSVTTASVSTASGTSTQVLNLQEVNAQSQPTNQVVRNLPSN